MKLWPFNSTKTETAPAPQPRRSIRQFTAAQINRLTSSWTTQSTSMDSEIMRQLNVLRARSRDLCQNNPYARKFLQMCVTNIVGPNGFNIQIRPETTDSKGKKAVDKADSLALETAFWDWCVRGNCDVTGKHSFFDICNLYIKAVARDGEVLIRKTYGKSAGKYGFQLQILDIERLDVDKNDRMASNGNMIKMGVEVDKYGKVVAYHVRIQHPGDSYYYTYKGSLYEVIAADDMYHHFISDRPEQTRGYPWLATAMMALQNLGGYEEAAVVAARVGAAKMGFFTSPDGDGSAAADGTENADGTGQLITEADPGTFGVLPTGWKFESFNPDYPTAMYKDFVKTCLRSISSALGVSYNTLSNDLEGVNFSSIRSGVIEERDNWMFLQRWMIENFLNDLYQTWLKFALMSGAVKGPTGVALPITKYDKFNAATWQGRRWQWVDPVKDLEASVLAINNGLRSRESVIAEQGLDIDDVWTSLAAEQIKIKELGIEIAPANPNAAAILAQQPDTADTAAPADNARRLK